MPSRASSRRPRKLRLPKAKNPPRVDRLRSRTSERARSARIAPFLHGRGPEAFQSTRVPFFGVAGQRPCMAEATNHSPAAPPLDLLTGAALFLDFDGTLVELAPTPDGVSVSPRLTRLLDRLTRILEGRVAIVSGRPVALLRKLLPIPMLTVGSHGMEFGA